MEKRASDRAHPCHQLRNRSLYINALTRDAQLKSESLSSLSSFSGYVDFSEFAPSPSLCDRWTIDPTSLALTNYKAFIFAVQLCFY